MSYPPRPPLLQVGLIRAGKGDEVVLETRLWDEFKVGVRAWGWGWVRVWVVVCLWYGRTGGMDVRCLW